MSRVFSFGFGLSAFEDSSSFSHTQEKTTLISCWMFPGHHQLDTASNEKVNKEEDFLPAGVDEVCKLHFLGGCKMRNYCKIKKSKVVKVKK